MIEWIIYNTLIPLLPIPLVQFASKLLDKYKNTFSIINDGQLFFYCTTIISTLLKDIHTVESLGDASGFLYLLLIVCVFLFGVTTTAERQTKEKMKNWYGWSSIAMTVTVTFVVLAIRYSKDLL